MASIMAQAIAGHPSWRPPTGYGGNTGLQRAAARPQTVGTGTYGGNQGLQAAATRPQTVGTGTYGGNQGLQQAAARGGATIPSAQPGPTAPTAAATAPAAGTAGQPPGPPLDATYYGNVAQHQFQTNNTVNQENLAGQRDQTALASVLAQLAYQQPRDQLKLEQNANQGGGLYSSVYDQNLGNLNYGYLGKQGAAQANYATQMDDIAAKIAAAEGGEPLYEAQQAAASTARAAAMAAKDPSQGQGTGGVNIPSLTPAHPATATVAHPAARPAAHPVPVTKPSGPARNGKTIPAIFIGNAAASGAPWAKALLGQKPTLASRVTRRTGP